jgi:hypothetical protein
MNTYGIKKYKEEKKIQIKVESTHGNERVKTFSVYSEHENGSMMIRTSRGALLSMKGHTIRSTAFRSKKLYDVIEVIEDQWEDVDAQDRDLAEEADKLNEIN